MRALACRGLSNQAIADYAYLSINAVKNYIGSTSRKIDVSTRPKRFPSSPAPRTAPATCRGGGETAFADDTL